MELERVICIAKGATLDKNKGKENFPYLSWKGQSGVIRRADQKNAPDLRNFCDKENRGYSYTMSEATKYMRTENWHPAAGRAFGYLLRAGVTLTFLGILGLDSSPFDGARRKNSGRSAD